MKKIIIIIGVILILIVSFYFCGCIETESRGILRLQITDKPGDMEIVNVNVNISMVQVHKSNSGGEEIDDYENFDEFNDKFVTYIIDDELEYLVDEEITFTGGYYDDDKIVKLPVSWLWDLGDGTTSSQIDQVTHIYSIPGVYYVNLTITDDSDLFDWYNITISIKEDLQDDSNVNWITVFEGPETYDLIEIKDLDVLLGEEIIDIGKYTQIRLTINNANITIKDEDEFYYFDLKIPSNKIKLIKPFWIYEQKITVLTLDFDVNESVHQTGKNNYLMKPTIKVIAEYLE